MAIRKASTVLKRARARLARPYGWTKQVHRRAVDRPVQYAYCAIGAVSYLPNTTSQAKADAMDYLESTVGWEVSVVSFNDDPQTTKTDVLALYDKAIARAERVGA